MSDKSKDQDEAERKAKAARAKKLLAQKRKEKEKNKASSVATPSSPLSNVADGLASGRTSLSLDDHARPELEKSPLQQHAEQSGPNVDKVYSTMQEEPKFSMAITEDPTPATDIRADNEASESKPSEPAPVSAHTDSLGNLQETISLLMAERSDLQSQITGLKESLEAAKGDSKLLEEGRALISTLEQEKRSLEDRLEAEAKKSERVVELESTSSTLEEELVALKKEHTEAMSRSESELAESKRKEEEVQSKVLEAEKALERAREREGGLEAEIGRLRQTNSDHTAQVTTLEAKLEGLQTSSSKDSSALADLKTKHEALGATHNQLQVQVKELEQTIETLRTENQNLASEREAATTSQGETNTALEGSRKELKEAREKLDSATKRAETTEKKRSALQEENGELIKQLEEVRGRVVEVMEEKVLLANGVESWETKARSWDKQKEGLDSEVESLKVGLRTLIVSDTQAQLAELSSTHEANSGSQEKQARELAEIKEQLAAREEELKSSRETIEKLHLASKDAEGTESEAVASLRSTHTLEVSQHAEKIRNLEASLHASTSRVHDLSRQLGDLQDAYTALQKNRDDAIAAPSTFSPRAVGSSTRGLFLSPAEETPSSSSPSYFPDQRNGGPSRPFSVDSLLPASVRHKRQVSLTALKARMEHSHSYTRPPIDRMDSVSETADKSRRGSTTSASTSTDTPGIASALGFVNSRRKARQQFGDEIVGCCPACEGDIISL